MSDLLLQTRDLSKAYGGVQALSEVSMEIRAGEIHALIGENGAGKSTFIKILSGSVPPDRGQIDVGGMALPLAEVSAAEAAGIAVIHQESTAFPHLNTFDNLFIGREPRRFMGFLDRPRMRRETRALMERLGERFDPHRPLGELSLAQRQMVGIARALLMRSRLLILDEPTASLSARETETLFRLIRQMQAEGTSILYISHRLEEIFALADRVTVFRDGRKVETRPIESVDRGELIRLMVGREVSEGTVPALRPEAEGKFVLEVERLSREGAFRNVSFQVRAGEIVGLAGLVGAGRSEVAETIFGIYAPDSGAVRVSGAPLPPGSVREAVKRGIALVPEDRQQMGLVLPMPVGANLALAVLQSLSRLGLRSFRAENELVERLMREMAVRASSADVPASALSGGNQQKLVLGKWLAASPKALILDEPTRGVDVGAKAEVYRLIRQLAEQGMATLLISSDLPEVLALSDRILVMREGEVSGELAGAEATQERVLALALPDATRERAA